MTALRVFVPFALGYFLSYLYRTVNNVIAPDLAQDVELSAGDLGLLTSTYFLTFAAFQLPLGILLDRYGPRRTEAVLLLFAAAGAALFAASDSLSGLLFGRGLIGFGVSACLMAAFTAFVAWFPRDKLPLVNGLQMTAGGLGALTATAPVEWALGFTDWRGLFWVIAGATLLVALTVWTVVPEKARPQAGASLGEAARGVREVFTSPVFWRAAPITFASQTAYLSIQSLWSGPWLRDVAGFGRAEVAEWLFYIAVAMMCGFLTMGTLATRLARHGITPMTVAVSGMVLFLLVQLALALQWTGPALALWIAFGFFGTSGIVPYSALSQAFPPHLAGRVNTGLNLLVFVGAFAFQWGIGEIIDLWPGPGEGSYAPEGYQAAFVFAMAVQAAALVWFLVRRGTPIVPAPIDRGLTG